MNDVFEHQGSPNFDLFLEAVLSWPLQTKIGMALFAITWLVGGNVLMHFSLRRRGIPYWKTMFPTPDGFRAVFGLNWNEWLVLVLLALTAFSFAAWGMAGAEG